MTTKVGDFVRTCHQGATKSYLSHSVNRVEQLYHGMVGIREFSYMKKLSWHKSWVRVPHIAGFVSEHDVEWE